MELKELYEKTIQIFNIKDIKELSAKLYEVCIENQTEYYDKFIGLVEDIEEDYLQKIFQYYIADRENLKQDYTPKSLAELVAALSNNNEDIVIDMCAGSGSLTIQKWKENNNLEFICQEYDENVIPFLLFNLAVRNIKAKVQQKDVLEDVVISEFEIVKTEKFGKVEKIK